jgi:hypothetical protein
MLACVAAELATVTVFRWTARRSWRRETVLRSGSTESRASGIASPLSGLNAGAMFCAGESAQHNVQSADTDKHSSSVTSMLWTGPTVTGRAEKHPFA